jgi:hypothetical protein
MEQICHPSAHFGKHNIHRRHHTASCDHQPFNNTAKGTDGSFSEMKGMTFWLTLTIFMKKYLFFLTVILAPFCRISHHM